MLNLDDTIPGQKNNPKPAKVNYNLPPSYEVVGNEVHLRVVGGKSRPIGFVKDGVAYEWVVGGSPRPIWGRIGGRPSI